MNKTFDDLTVPPDLRDHGDGTGPIQKKHPVYADMLPPCNHACPAGENIQAWIALARDENYQAAWEMIMKDNPLPAVSGRVCYHTCESQCNRANIDSTVSIHAIERFIGDEALKHGWQIPVNPPTGKRVLVIGAGPSGLSAAYHLTRMGHQVEIYEAGPMAGGMMHFGIPAYRLPRKELKLEVERIQKMGVKFVFNHKVADVLAEKEKGKFDAVFIAIGSQLSQKTEIPSRDAGKILDAVTFLKQVEVGDAPKLGTRVAIYGGGNTAMDAARTAKRLGATEAMIIYRRDRDHMPAHDFEAQEALEEGVKINWLRTIKEIDGQNFTVEVMELVDGKPVPTGRFETLEADNLILALGQQTDTDFLRELPGIMFKPNGTVIVNNQMMTGSDGIFAGGDMVPGERSVTVAIGHGKKAAQHINAYLTNEVYEPAEKHPVAGYDGLHRWYATQAPMKKQAELPATERTANFDEVRIGLSRADVLFEAHRCLSCGNCFECDGCFGACPQQAIVKLGVGKRYAFNYSLCTGCAVCYEQCPCGAIEMVSGSRAI